MSRSGKFYRLIKEQERERRDEGSPEREEEIEEMEPYHVSLLNFPGGAETFESAAKFCYGVKVELNPCNVAPLRCAAEYLEMTDELGGEDNLVSRCERFLNQSVLRSLKDSVETLKSCELLIPMAETLGIVQRGIDAIAARAAAVSESSSSLFGWPVNERTGGVGSSDRRILDSYGVTWFESLTALGLPLFQRTVLAMKARGLRPDLIEGCLLYYARRCLPGLSRSGRKSSGGGLPSEAEQRKILEAVLANLPTEKTSAAGTRFLFGLLRTINILRAPETSREILERKIALQLDRASLDDLLIPSYSYLTETLYDVDCVERIVGYFVESLCERGLSGDEESRDGTSPESVRPLLSVGKLVDGYLSEIASDGNLRPEKFCDLALALPDIARIYDDGLYRAVDVYLKVRIKRRTQNSWNALGLFGSWQAHSRIGEAERERVCSVMDYQKLTLEACTHAAQNERLPLRAVVQVLFFEQLQLRHAIAGTLISDDESGRVVPSQDSRHSGGEGDTRPMPGRGNQVLRLDMDSMRSRVNELERECTSMKRVLQKIDRGGPARRHEASGQSAAGGGWNSFTKKFGCKFKPQVCDLRNRAVVESQRSRIAAAPPPRQELRHQLQLEESF